MKFLQILLLRNSANKGENFAFIYIFYENNFEGLVSGEELLSSSIHKANLK